MAFKTSKHLVIDASIARAAGGDNAIFPTSKDCRDFLNAVLRICHRVVMTPDIREEWKKHRSRFARRWLVEMVSKKKMVSLGNLEINRELWGKVETFAETDKQREEMVKDLRLIEAALATDKTIVSLDDNTARKFFGQATTQIETLQSIVWVNPAKPAEEAITWLEQGAEPESKRCLGFRP